jgi:hypothetical protein
LLFAGASGLLYGAAVETGLTGAESGDLALRVWLGTTALVVVWNFAQGVFSPHLAQWRQAPIESPEAARLRLLFLAIFVMFVIDRVLSAGFKIPSEAH